jgi:SOS response regulatory protein OraA/RecX
MAGKRTPGHAMRIAELQPELAKFGVSHKEIDTALRELFNDERIEAGQTINDTWVKTK